MDSIVSILPFINLSRKLVVYFRTAMPNLWIKSCEVFLPMGKNRPIAPVFSNALPKFEV